MLKLKNVSKFYYSNGVIASGFSRVNLELNMGEFVVITGESGSGKSTLLNVLSGLDTYEEGELYINGEETSHYNEKDFEEYRRKYVGNIFQNFNLVNSYTVYENVELALILNGESKRAAKERVMAIIDKVGLTDFAGTKCSKLSGGQKQRVAIARALAKETPIIVADEPTGNLDSKSAAEVIKLLSEISKDKLVIIVTHNIEQVEQYATRLIKMHDGKILEDKTVSRPSCAESVGERSFADITFGDKLRLGSRNAFNIPAKFILIFAVFLFISLAVAGTYSSFQELEYEEGLYGYNEFFSDTSDNRIVINKPDRSVITGEDFDAISKLDNVQRVAQNDMLVDYSMGIMDKDYYNYFYGNFVDIDDFAGKVDEGRMPQNPYEIVVEMSPDNYSVSQNPEDILNTTFYMEMANEEGMDTNKPIRIVGIVYNSDLSMNGQSKFYAGDEILDDLRLKSAARSNNIKTLFEGDYYYSEDGNAYFFIEPNANVPKGSAYVSSELNEMTATGRATGKEIEVSTESIYSKDSVSLTVTQTYNKNNFKSLLGEDYDESRDGIIYINEQQYNQLVNKGIFQSSVYVKDVKTLDDTAEALQNLGFNTLKMRDSLNDESSQIRQMVSLMKTFVLAMLIIALFFISYFIIKVVLKSRNTYYTTLRTLGASKKVSKQLLDIELILTASIAYGVFLAVMLAVYAGLITQSAIVNLAGYLTPVNYVIMYVIIVAMSYMISHRFARKLFKDSVMNTYREEV